MPRSRWPLTHEYSPEARNLIWLSAAHYDEKVDIQHKKTSQQLKFRWLNNVWRLYQATVCAWIQASFLMVMNHGAEAHTTVAFRYFRTKNFKKKHESSFTTLRWQKMISPSNWPFKKKSLHLNDNTGFCNTIQASKLVFGSLLAKNNFFVQFWTKILHPPGSGLPAEWPFRSQNAITPTQVMVYHWCIPCETLLHTGSH